MWTSPWVRFGGKTMATAANRTNTDAPSVLRPIEGNVLWTDPNRVLTFNIVQLANAAELNLFNGQMPTIGNPAMTVDLAPVISNAEFELAFSMFNDVINFTLQLDDNNINAD